MKLYKQSEDKFWYDLESEDEHGRKHNVVIEFDHIIDALKQYAKDICGSKGTFEENMCDIVNDISKEVFGK